MVFTTELYRKEHRPNRFSRREKFQKSALFHGFFIFES